MESIGERNRDYEVQDYLPGFVMIGDDSGNALLTKQEETEVYEVGMGVMDEATMLKSAGSIRGVADGIQGKDVIREIAHRCDLRYQTMFIRPAELGDLPTLRDIFLRSRQAAFHWESPYSFDLGDFDSQTEGEFQMVALDRELPVGFISVWEPDYFIHHLHVDPRFSRRGIGRALIFALPGWKVNRYRLKCVAANERALAFYRANHFIQIGEGRANEQDYLLLESVGR